MSVVSFIDKYAVEALAVAEALNSIIGGVALPPSEREKVQKTIDTLQIAADNISKNKPKTVVINQADIDKAVAKVLPKLVNDAVAKALVKGAK